MYPMGQLNAENLAIYIHPEAREGILANILQNRHQLKHQKISYLSGYTIILGGLFY
jgi:hypothetical protein